MSLFRGFLVVFLLVLFVYTAIVMRDHGANLFPHFFGDLATMNWAGQFNLDFMGFLMLSCLWTLWRNAFSPAGLVLGIFAFFGGMMFLSVYLLYLSVVCQGDVSRMLLGPSRTQSREAST